MVQYRLRDVFSLLTLAPFSAGIAYVGELSSAAVYEYVDPTLLRIDFIASATGWQPRNNRTLFLFILSAFESITYGGLFALTMLYLFLLRHRWATMAAFSLPFGILFFQCLKPGLVTRMLGQPVMMTTSMLVPMLAWASPPSLVAICLAFLGWRVTNRMSTHELGTETAFFQRPPWQRYVVAASCVIYFSASAYGWYRMLTVRRGAW